MIKETISALKLHLANLPGWRTNRKIVVIESDDWGSIRMPSKEAYHSLLNAGIRVDICPYNRYDSLASQEDLQALFEVLRLFKDKNGNHPVITANTVVANPDFDKIKASGFQEYHYEPFTETLKRYPRHGNAFDLWQQGISEKIFWPQFHGREHVNIPLWLNFLQKGHPAFLKAFEFGLWGLGPEIIKSGNINIQASFDATEQEELENHKSVIEEGLELFEKMFGFKSQSFIANNFIWDPRLNRVLTENGVFVLQGMKYQKLPLLGLAKRKMIRHFTGKRNGHGQVYLVRNCIFEPTQYPDIDSVSTCLKDISTAFFWRNPAIITAHRLNFIGTIDERNRNENLKMLKKLLAEIVRCWPEVEFMTSDKLGELIVGSKFTC